MGEGSSKPQQEQPFVLQFKSNHTSVQEGYDDPRLGRVNIYKSNDGTYVAVKKSFSHNSSQQETFSNRLQQAITEFHDCPYLLKLLGYGVQDDKSMCGTVSEMQTYHEYYLNNLEAEVQQRQQSNLYYSEPELWVILYSCIQSLSFLNSYERNINDVRPQNIYITPNGQLKLVAFQNYPEDVPGFQKVAHYNDQCYLPPEQLQEVREKAVKSNADQEKSDMYAIGQTILQCATLNTSVDCYDWDTYELRKDIIEQRLLQIQQVYSKFFVNMVRILLNDDVNNRPSASDIQKILEPYESQILNLTPFQPSQQQISQHLQQLSPPKPQSIPQPLQQQQISSSYYQPQLQQQPQYIPQQQQTETIYQSQIPQPQQVQHQQSPVQFTQSKQAFVQQPEGQQFMTLSQQQQHNSQVTQSQFQQGRGLTFEQLPLEVQEQIKRGEKGPIVYQGQGGQQAHIQASPQYQQQPQQQVQYVQQPLAQQYTQGQNLAYTTYNQQYQPQQVQYHPQHQQQYQPQQQQQDQDQGQGQGQSQHHEQQEQEDQNQQEQQQQQQPQYQQVQQQPQQEQNYQQVHYQQHNYQPQAQSQQQQPQQSVQYQQYQQQQPAQQQVYYQQPQSHQQQYQYQQQEDQNQQYQGQQDVSSRANNYLQKTRDYLDNNQQQQQ